MDVTLQAELIKLTKEYFKIASNYIDKDAPLNEKLKKAIGANVLTEGSELPGYENRDLRFGKFENREFVVMMTDIRASTKIINAPGGLIDMFLIFYIYAGIVAKIVDKYNGTATEFLGDGVLNLFDTKDIGRDEALRNSMSASWNILEAREKILNPFFLENGIPEINLGIGIDHGVTIVTQFGYRNDTDLKAFGACAYNASKLCKGMNQVIVSENSKNVWPSSPGGNLLFSLPQSIEGKNAYTAYKGF